MTKYKLIATEEQLVQQGFVHRQYHNNFIKVLVPGDENTKQELCCIVSLITKEVDVFIHCLKDECSQEVADDADFKMKLDIFSEYINAIVKLLTDNIITEKIN